MTSSVLEKIRCCCGNPKSHLIFYDGANTADLPVLVCDECFENSTFQKFIVSRFKITEKTNVSQLLQNYQTE